MPSFNAGKGTLFNRSKAHKILILGQSVLDSSMPDTMVYEDKCELGDWRVEYFARLTAEAEKYRQLAASEEPAANEPPSRRPPKP